MADILIEWIETATPGDFPTAAVDAYGPYMPFAVGKEAGFSFAVDPKYIVGSNLVLKIRERTLGQSLKHKWSVTVLLNGDDTATYTSEVTSSATADTLTTRLVTISTAGGIDGTAIVASDLVYLKLERIAASASEDSNPIRVYLGMVLVNASGTNVSGYQGRVGQIVDAVMKRSNDEEGDMCKPDEVLDWLVEATGEITKREYWKKITTITWVTTDGTFDLLDEIPDVEQVLWVSQVIDGTECVYRLIPKDDFDAFTQREEAYQNSATAERRACIVDNTLYIYPIPSAAGSLTVFHSYCPADLDGLENTSPRIPKSHDNLYIHFCRAQLADKDHGKPDWKDLYQLHMGRFEKALDDLMAQSIHGGG